MLDFGTVDCGQFCAGCVLHKEERMQGRAVWTLVRHTFLYHEVLKDAWQEVAGATEFVLDQMF